jgi:hypothetical protein
MGDDRPVITGDKARHSYSSLAFEINRRFCENKGWDFRYEQYLLPKRPWGVWQGFSRTVGDHRAPTWIKLIAVHRVLGMGYDYVIWIDSDCIFYNHDRSWESILTQFTNPELHLIGWLDKPFHTNKFCAGFFIVKNAEAVKKMFERIWLSSSKYSWAFPYEQYELNSFLSQSPENFYVFLDEPMFELESSDQFLLHVAGFEHQNRVPKFLQWFANQSILPNPQKVDEHVFHDLNVDAYDGMLSGLKLSFFQIIQREFWGLAQHSRQRLKKAYYALKSS